METIKSTFTIFTGQPSFFTNQTSQTSHLQSFDQAPASRFQLQVKISDDSRAAIAEYHPELLDLADNGSLLLIQKKQFGPVPSWRSEFVEPEAIWLNVTTHISKESAMEVERVVRAVKPDNVVVELCRSRVHFQIWDWVFWRCWTQHKLGWSNCLGITVTPGCFLSKVSSDVDRPFGDEFRAARKASEEVGAQIVLGDRPIEITLGMPYIWKHGEGNGGRLFSTIGMGTRIRI